MNRVTSQQDAGLTQWDTCRKSKVSVHEYVQRKFGKETVIELSAGISSICETDWNFKQAFRQAKYALEYHYNSASFQVLCYDRLNAGEEVSYNVTFDDEVKLSNLLKAGDTDHALQFVNELLDEFFIGHRIKREDAIYMFNEILSVCAKVVHDMGKRVADIVDYKEFLSLIQFNRMNRYVLQCVAGTCHAADEMREEKENGLGGRIVSYIRENYQNSSLTMTFLADFFHVSPIYVSNAVKKSVNINFIGYFNQIRIEKANELLEKLALTIREIAGMTGYDSDKNFIRVFTKYEGVTPGQYRKMEDVSEE